MAKNVTPSSYPHTRPGELLTLLQEISIAVAQAESTATAYKQVLTLICRFIGWPLGHVYVWSSIANAFVSSHIWYTDDAAPFPSFRELSENTYFPPGEGTVGQVRASGQPLFILDLRHTTQFLRQLKGISEAVQAYFAFPIIVEEQVIAVLEFFSHEPAEPVPEITAIIKHAGALLGLAEERQQAWQRLQHSESRLAEAQRLAHIGHWEWNIVRDEVIWSAEIYQIFGLSPDKFETTLQGFIECIHPEDREMVQNKVTRAFKNGRPFNYFHRIIRPDGETRVVHARGRPIFDQHGKIVKLYGTVQDMTEQKETELKLAHTVRQLSALMKIGLAISSSLDLDVIYARVLKLLRPLLEAEILLLFLSVEDALEIVATDQDGVPGLQGRRVSIDDQSVAGQVWRSGQSLFLKGKACRQRLSPLLVQATGYRPEAMLAVPVRWQDQSVGVLEAAHRQKDAFDDEDLRLLEIAASWTAIAIGNARQYEQLQRRLNENNAITAISYALTDTLELDELLHLIVTHVQDVVPHAEWATIHLSRSNTNQNQLELVASAGLEVDKNDYLIKSGTGLAGQVMSTGEVINVPDVQTDPRRLSIDENINTRSLLVAPVESRYSLLGTISVQCATPSSFTVEDERLLKVLGIQAGIAIENARLFFAQRRARKTAEMQRERIRNMARRLVKAQEDERARIARELHDESGQTLTSLKIGLSLLFDQLSDDSPEIQNSYHDLLELVDHTINSLRLLSHNLRPPGLDIYGLDAALSGLCQDFEKHTTLKVNYSGADLEQIDDLTALCLYRFAQESLTNIVKHAGATEVKLALRKDEEAVRLWIQDNGQGFSPPGPEKNFPVDGAGLAGMTERIEMVNGHLEIESTPAQGTRLQAIIPVGKKA